MMGVWDKEVEIRKISSQTAASSFAISSNRLSILSLSFLIPSYVQTIRPLLSFIKPSPYSRFLAADCHHL